MMAEIKKHSSSLPIHYERAMENPGPDVVSVMYPKISDLIVQGEKTNDQRPSPSVAKAGGSQSLGAKGEIVALHYDPLATMGYPRFAFSQPLPKSLHLLSVGAV